MAQSQNVPDEFEKVIKDFIKDIKTTFPEYEVFIKKWWKEDSHFASIEDESERKEAIEKSRKNSIQFIFKFCLRKFPPRFFDILYQNNDIFKEDSEVDTEFLPQIHFKNLWECDITDKTRETIWKYLQLIMFSIVNCVENRDAFGDTTAEMFESMNTEDFRSKLQETLSDIQQIFEQNQGKGEEGEESQEGDENNSANPSHGLPNANDIYSHVSGMLGGKLGQLAKEIAEETAESFNLDTDNMTNVNDVLQGLMKNPAKMMNLVKNVGQKLDSKIKSGDIKESELISEASDMIKKMKDIPGMGNIQDILSKMGMGGRGSKVNLNAMQEQLDRNMKAAQTRERMRNNVDKKQQQQQQQPKPVPPPSQKPAYTDEELVTIMNKATQGTTEKTEKTEKKDKKKKAHKKK